MLCILCVVDSIQCLVKSQAARCLRQTVENVDQSLLKSLTTFSLTFSDQLSRQQPNFLLGSRRLHGHPEHRAAVSTCERPRRNPRTRLGLLEPLLPVECTSRNIQISFQASPASITCDGGT